jgi:hypothetical protein
MSESNSTAAQLLFAATQALQPLGTLSTAVKMMPRVLYLRSVERRTTVSPAHRAKRPCPDTPVLVRSLLELPTHPCRTKLVIYGVGGEKVSAKAQSGQPSVGEGHSRLLVPR